MAPLTRALYTLSLAAPALGSLRGATQNQSANATSSVGASSSSTGCAQDPVACAQEEFRGSGVLVKMLSSGSDLNKAMDQTGSDLAKLWNTKIDGTGLINDCDGDIQDCSAWAFLKQGLVPMVYNYPDIYDSAGELLPPKQHMVGIMAKRTPQIEGQISRMHVVDGDTWHRYLGGLHPDDDLVKNLGHYCPGWEKEDVKKIKFMCVPKKPTPTSSWCNADASPRRIEAPIGEGGASWSDQFMYTELFNDDSHDLSKETTMVRQCEFWPDSSGKWDWDFYFGALKSFYDKAIYQQEHGQVKALPDGALYLENEVNMEGLAPEKVMEIVDDGLLAVVVQTNTCEEQLVSLGTAEAKTKCDAIYNTKQKTPLPTDAAFPTAESYMIDESKRAACRLAVELSKATGRSIPAVEAKFTTNSVVDVENWRWYTEGKSDPTDFLSSLDCCAEYSLGC